MCDASIVALAGMAAEAEVHSETFCVRKLLCHAARCPRDLGLVSSALQLLACRMGYPSTNLYLDYHFAVSVLDEWCLFDNGLDIISHFARVL